MLCPQCGVENEKSTLYCVSCGSAIDMADAESFSYLMDKADREAAETTRKRVRELIAIGIVLFFVAVAATFLLPDIPPDESLPDAPPTSLGTDTTEVFWRSPLNLKEHLMVVPESE